MEIIDAMYEIDERLVWHKPEFQRLAVSLDTGIEIGSNIDGGEGTLK
jgi:hypothetical protein